MIKEDNKILGPLISLKNIPDKGLRICWNFQGLMQQVDYEIYHIFFYVGVCYEQGKKLLKMYYQNMKLGELVGIYQQSNDEKENSKKQIKWTQKTGFDFQQDFFKEKHIWKQLLQKDLMKLINQTAKNRGQIIVNIVTTQQILKDFPTFTSIIKNIRQKNIQSQKFIFNFICKFNSITRIDCMQGVNVFFYQQHNRKKLISQIKNYLKVIVIKKLRVRIYLNNNYHCQLNGDDSWKVSQASYLEKTYYAIPSCNFRQYLVFISSDQDPELQINLKFVLDITYYNDKQLVSKRQINYVTDSNQMKFRTVFNSDNSFFGPTQLKKHVYWTNLIKKYCYVIIFKTLEH